MKIGFCGAQGTGKTSVAKLLAKDPEMLERNWKFVPSTARLAMSEGYKLNRDADELGQLLTTCSRIVAEYRMEDEVTSVFSDRTPLDSLAYTAYQMTHVWDDGNQYFWKISEGLVQKAMEEYDHIFYFPVFWAPVADGDRDPDTGYQAAVDEYIVALLNTFNLKHQVVPNFTVEERVEIIKTHIFG